MCLPSKATEIFNAVLEGYSGFLVTPHIKRRIEGDVAEMADVRAVIIRSFENGVIEADVFPHHAQGYRLTLGVAGAK